jgi:ABC-2 type transport system ATP-binding protein
VEIRELLAELARMGKTIFFSTHILADVEDICSHIGIVEAGQVLMQGSLDQLKTQLMETRDILITLLDNEQSEKVKSLALGRQGVRNVEFITPKGGRNRLRVEMIDTDEGIQALHRAIFDAGIVPLGFQEEEKTLETMFMKVTRGLVT